MGWQGRIQSAYLTMAHKYTLECVDCGTKTFANDTHDIRQLHWEIIAWIVPSGDPRCRCPACTKKKYEKLGK